MIRLEALLDSWKSVREDTAQAVEEFPAAELDFKPAADLMSFREIARHILIAGHGLTGLLLAGELNLTGPQFREKLAAQAPKLPPDAPGADLVRELRTSIEQRVKELAAQSPDFYAGIVTRVDGAQVTRMEMLQFVKEHELTHRSQLFLYSRLKASCR